MEQPKLSPAFEAAQKRASDTYKEYSKIYQGESPLQDALKDYMWMDYQLAVVDAEVALAEMHRNKFSEKLSEARQKYLDLLADSQKTK